MAITDDVANDRLLFAANVMQLQAAGRPEYIAWGIGTQWRGRDLDLKPGNDAFWLPLVGEPFYIGKSRNAVLRQIRDDLDAIGGDDIYIKPNAWNTTGGANQYAQASGLSIDDLESFYQDLQSQLVNTRTFADLAALGPTEGQAQTVNTLMDAIKSYKGPLIADSEFLSQTVGADRFLTAVAFELQGHNLPPSLAAKAYVNILAAGAPGTWEEIHLVDHPYQPDRAGGGGGQYRPAGQPSSGGGIGKLIIPAGAGLAGWWLGGPLGAVLGAVGGSLVDWFMGPSTPTRPTVVYGDTDGPRGPGAP